MNRLQTAIFKGFFKFYIKGQVVRSTIFIYFIYESKHVLM